MTPEIEMASPSVGINSGDKSDATITRASETSESNSNNGGQGRGWVCCTGRGGNQGRDGIGVRFNLPA